MNKRKKVHNVLLLSPPDSPALAVRLRGVLVSHSFVSAGVRGGTGWESVFLPGPFSLMHQKVLHSSARKCLIHVGCKSCMCHIRKLLSSPASADFTLFSLFLQPSLFTSQTHSLHWSHPVKQIHKNIYHRAETFRPRWIIYTRVSAPHPLNPQRRAFIFKAWKRAQRPRPLLRPGMIASGLLLVEGGSGEERRSWLLMWGHLLWRTF